MYADCPAIICSFFILNSNNKLQVHAKKIFYFLYQPWLVTHRSRFLWRSPLHFLSHLTASERQQKLFGNILCLTAAFALQSMQLWLCQLSQSRVHTWISFCSVHLKMLEPHHPLPQSIKLNYYIIINKYFININMMKRNKILYKK